MDSIDQLIRGRRAWFVPQFNGEEIPRQVLEHLLENANWAPTHKRTEPWRFRVFFKKAKEQLFEKLGELYRETSPPGKFSESKYLQFRERSSLVSHVIGISVKRNDLPGLPEVEEICAVAAAVQNLWLTLAGYPRYGGYWGTGDLVFSEGMRTILDLGEDERCLGLFYMGVIRKDPKMPLAQRGPWQEKVVWRE